MALLGRLIVAVSAGALLLGVGALWRAHSRLADEKCAVIRAVEGLGDVEVSAITNMKDVFEYQFHIIALVDGAVWVSFHVFDRSLAGPKAMPEIGTLLPQCRSLTDRMRFSPPGGLFEKGPKIDLTNFGQVVRNIDEVHSFFNTWPREQDSKEALMIQPGFKCWVYDTSDWWWAPNTRPKCDDI